MSDIYRIRAAAARGRGRLRRTPLLSAAALDRRAGRRVWVKAECLQITGSFKARGAWAAMSALPPEALRGGVLAFSSGNHAQGVAWAAAAHGAPAVILMPKDASSVKIEGARALGAEVMFYDRLTEDRAALGAEIAAARRMTIIPPYDHPEVIAGQGTTGLEIARDAAEAGIRAAEVLVCCGGGGLASGIALALSAEAPDFATRTVEPAGFDDMARSLRAGERRTNAQPTGSICDAILTPRPGEMTFPILRNLAGEGLAVSDEEALRAMSLAFAHLNVVLEPGGAVALAAALFHPEDLRAEDVIAVASGGNVEPALFAQAITRHPA